MENDVLLQAKAKEIKDTLRSGVKSIPLDKPRATPENQTIASSSKVDGTTDSDSSEQETTTDSGSAPASNNATDVTYSSGQSLPFIGGYKLSDILEAPFKPPKPVATEDISETSDRKVILLVAIGTVLVILSIGCILVDQVKLGVAFLILGTIVVVTAVFAPIP